MSLPPTIAHAVQTTQTWLNELCERGDFADNAEAVSALRCVLHQLRDRLTLEEAVNLSAQLPLIIRGIYFEGWRPHKPQSKAHTKQDFLDELADRRFPNAIPIEQAVRDIFALLAHHCDPNEIADVIEQLPQDIKLLWPETARSFRAQSK